MKKIWFTLIGIVAILVILLVIVHFNKPGKEELAIWIENEYSVECFDSLCNELTIIRNNTNAQENTYWLAEGYYNNSAGFLGMSIRSERLYRSTNNDNKYFSIEVVGYMGKFFLLDFNQHAVNILK